MIYIPSLISPQTNLGLVLKGTNTTSVNHGRFFYYTINMHKDTIKTYAETNLFSPKWTQHKLLKKMEKNF